MLLKAFFLTLSIAQVTAYWGDDDWSWGDDDYGSSWSWASDDNYNSYGSSSGGYTSGYTSTGGGDGPLSEQVNDYNTQVFEAVPAECLSICYDMEMTDSGSNGWDGGDINLQIFAQYSTDDGAQTTSCDLTYDSWTSGMYYLSHSCDRVGDAYKLVSGSSETTEVCFPDPSVSGCEQYEGVCYDFNLADWLDNDGPYDNPVEWWGTMYGDSGEGASAAQHAEAGWSLKDPSTDEVIASSTGVGTTSICVGGVTKAPTMAPICFIISLHSTDPYYPWDTTFYIRQDSSSSVIGFNDASFKYNNEDSSEEAEEFEWCTPGGGTALFTIPTSTWDGDCTFEVMTTARDVLISGDGSGSWTLSLDSITGAPTVSPTDFPTASPTLSPTPSPTKSPIVGTAAPTKSPTTSPTSSPTPSPTLSPTTPPPTQAPTTPPPTMVPTNTPAPTVTPVGLTLNMETYDEWGDYIQLEIVHQTHKGKANTFSCNPEGWGVYSCTESLSLQNEGCFDVSLVTRKAESPDPACFTLTLDSYDPDATYHFTVGESVVYNSWSQQSTSYSSPAFVALSDLDRPYDKDTGVSQPVQFCTPPEGEIAIDFVPGDGGEQCNPFEPFEDCENIWCPTVSQTCCATYTNLAYSLEEVVVYSQNFDTFKGILEQPIGGGNKEICQGHCYSSLAQILYAYQQQSWYVSGLNEALDEYCEELGTSEGFTSGDTSQWTLTDAAGNTVTTGVASGQTFVELDDTQFTGCEYYDTSYSCQFERENAKFRITLDDSADTLVATGEQTGSSDSFCLPWDYSNGITLAPTAAPIVDCAGQEWVSCSGCSDLLGDGNCDDTELNYDSTYHFNCAAFGFDNGDCLAKKTPTVCTVGDSPGVVTNPSSKACCAAVNDLHDALAGATDISSITTALSTGDKKDLYCDSATHGCFDDVTISYMQSISDAAVTALRQVCDVYSKAPTPSPTSAPTTECPSGKIIDCNGNCAEEAWLGGPTCDDVFDCVQFEYDEGACRKHITFTDCDGTEYSDFDCLTNDDIFYEGGDDCETAVANLKGNGNCDEKINCKKHDYDVDECGYEQCDLRGVDLGSVTPRCCDALEQGGIKALAMEFNLESFVDDGWCGKSCGHSSVVGFNVLDLITGENYKDRFITLCKHKHGINLEGGVGDSGTEDAYTGTYSFDLASGFSLPDGDSWPVNKTFSKSLEVILAAFEVEMDVPWAEVDNLLPPMMDPVEFKKTIISEISDSSALTVDDLNKNVFVEFVRASNYRRLQEVEDNRRILEEDEMIQCEVLFQDVGVVSKSCCKNITDAASVLMLTEDPDVTQYADSHMCRGSCYSSIANALTKLNEAQLGDYLPDFDSACAAKGHEPGQVIVPTPSPTPAPTTTTAAPTTAETTLMARFITAFKYEPGSLTAEGPGETFDEKVAEMKGILEDAAEYSSWGTVNLLEDFNKLVSVDMKTKGSNPSADDMDCLFAGAFSLGKTSHECCLIINTLAPIVINRGFEEVDFESSALFANEYMCNSCADVVLNVFEALETTPFNKDNLVQPFVDACYDSFDADLGAQYAVSTMPPTPSMIPCGFAGVALGKAVTPECCDYVKGSATGLNMGTLGIEAFVDAEKAMVCEVETCKSAAEKMLDIRSDLDLKKDFNILCDGGQLQSTDMKCEVQKPSGGKVNVGETDVECCNHLKSMFKRIKYDQGELGDDFTPQYADLTSCSGSCATTITTALASAEEWFEQTNLLAPFQQECERVEPCSYLGNELGETSTECCDDLTTTANSIIASEAELEKVEATYSRCDDRWGCKAIFVLGMGTAETMLPYEGILATFQNDCEQFTYADGPSGGGKPGGGGGNGEGGLVVEAPAQVLPGYEVLYEAFCANTLDCTLVGESVANELDCIGNLLGDAANLVEDDYHLAFSALFGHECDKVCLNEGTNTICVPCVAKIIETNLLCTSEEYKTITFDGTMKMVGLEIPSDEDGRKNVIDVLKTSIRIMTGEMTGSVEILSINGVSLTGRRSRKLLVNGDIKFQIVVPISCETTECTESTSKAEIKLKAIKHAMSTAFSSSCGDKCFADHLSQATSVVAESKGLDVTEFSSDMGDVFENAVISAVAIKDTFTESDKVEGTPQVGGGDGGGGVQIIDGGGRLTVGSSAERLLFALLAIVVVPYYVW